MLSNEFYEKEDTFLKVKFPYKILLTADIKESYLVLLENERCKKFKGSKQIDDIINFSCSDFIKSIERENSDIENIDIISFFGDTCEYRYELRSLKKQKCSVTMREYLESLVLELYGVVAKKIDDQSRTKYSVINYSLPIQIIFDLFNNKFSNTLYNIAKERIQPKIIEAEIDIDHYDWSGWKREVSDFVGKYNIESFEDHRLEIWYNEDQWTHIFTYTYPIKENNIKLKEEELKKDVLRFINDPIVLWDNCIELNLATIYFSAPSS
jgi:hypothetical protein